MDIRSLIGYFLSHDYTTQKKPRLLLISLLRFTPTKGLRSKRQFPAYIFLAVRKPLGFSIKISLPRSPFYQHC